MLKTKLRRARVAPHIRCDDVLSELNLWTLNLLVGHYTHEVTIGGKRGLALVGSRFPIQKEPGKAYAFLDSLRAGGREKAKNAEPSYVLQRLR